MTALITSHDQFAGLGLALASIGALIAWLPAVVRDARQREVARVAVAAENRREVLGLIERCEAQVDSDIEAVAWSVGMKPLDAYMAPDVDLPSWVNPPSSTEALAPVVQLGRLSGCGCRSCWPVGGER